MAERTIKIGSAGKIFSLTGWKIGWAVAPARLAEPIAKAHQFLTFSSAPNLQAAAAWGLGKADFYFEGMRAAFAKARDSFAAALGQAGYATLPAEGTYFICIDLAASGIPVGDVAFCERAVFDAGVAAIPISAFYAEAPVTNVVRLCFAKQQATLAAGAERLAKARAFFA
jgi:aspartate/methionine/tyrosine aminotransferase